MKSEQGRELDLASWSVRLFDSGICRRCFDQAMLSRYQIMQIQPSRPCLSLEQEQDSNNNININNNQIREHNPSTAATVRIIMLYGQHVPYMYMYSRQQLSKVSRAITSDCDCV